MKTGQELIETIIHLLDKSDKLCTDHNILKYLRSLSTVELSQLINK